MNVIKHTDFIPANESKFVITFFKWYTWLLMKRRFNSVSIRNKYVRKNGKSTLYICNHHYWWDGLTPLILNEFVFHQQARAVMEDKQMIEFPFFSKIGAFSINRDNPKSAIKSLKYGAEWLNEPDTCLFLYPEGKFRQPNQVISVEPGITKLLEWAPECDLVNVSMYISFQNGDKPDFYIDVSSILPHPPTDSKKKVVSIINEAMNTNLEQLRVDLKTPSNVFKRFI